MASELSNLMQQVTDLDPAIGKELRRHIASLTQRRENGLNFERHLPEQVALVGRPISVGDKVRFVPERGSDEVESSDTWFVTDITGPQGARVAHLVERAKGTTCGRAIDDLVYVADFRDPIYPGLKSTGRVERGGDRKPFHTVINSENYHALEALLFTHTGKVDAIYIDPPYNTRARDWKYNNDYVDPTDAYAHSMWLSFMERRLKLAKKLLNPADSVLIVTIDEKEYLRLGLLLEQTFPSARIQMVSSVIAPQGSSRGSQFKRSDEYIFFVFFGSAAVLPLVLGEGWGGAESETVRGKVHWASLKRTGTGAARHDRPGMYYPVFLSHEATRFHSTGKSLPPEEPRESVEVPEGCVAVWPFRRDGSDGRWQVGPETLTSLFQQGYARLGSAKGADTAVAYLKTGERSKIAAGEYTVIGHRSDGSVITAEESEDPGHAAFRPTTVWNLKSHSAGHHGSNIIRALVPGRTFTFPKSLYAVEDALRFFVANKPDALVLDFFSGSGTTAHAVMRLNKQDGGRRRSISVTNNEVSADEHKALIKRNLRPGDPEWEALGICDYITKPRIEAAITGLTPSGDPVKGDYKFTDEFPMADGFDENVEFFTLTYLNPQLVELDMAFSSVAPLLWIRAGAQGRRIDERADTFDVVDTYGVLFSLDSSAAFIHAVEQAGGLRVAYIVTDDEPQFQAVATQLPEGVEAVRLYESYLRTFQINTERD